MGAVKEGVMKSGNRSEWTFANVVHSFQLGTLTDPNELYKLALGTRENKRKMYEVAVNAALENIMSWERMARADGFRLVACTDINKGAPHPIVEGDVVKFVQSYGVAVVDEEVGNEEGKS